MKKRYQFYFQSEQAGIILFNSNILAFRVYPDDPQSEPVFATNVMGMINRKDGTFSVEQLDNSALSYVIHIVKYYTDAKFYTAPGLDTISFVKYCNFKLAASEFVKI